MNSKYRKLLERKIHIIPLFVLTISTVGIALVPKALTQETQLVQSSTSFTGGVPKLVGAKVPHSAVRFVLPKYYFTLYLPADANQPLGQVTIQQQENSETIQFNLDKTEAFEGTQDNKGQALEIKEVTQDPQTNSINVSFEPPVPPGTTMSIGLQAKQNPSNDGTYLFRISAFPAGENPMALDLGVGRLQFYQAF